MTIYEKFYAQLSTSIHAGNSFVNGLSYLLIQLFLYNKICNFKTWKQFCWLCNMWLSVH